MSDCSECKRDLPLRRGLCGACYKRHSKAGTLPPRQEPDRTCRAASDGQCAGSYMGKGLCSRHYYRQYQYGTTALTTMREAPDDVRYRANVRHGTAEECWPWTGSLITSTGYGNFFWDGTHTSAHIAGWELATGLIAAGFWIDHACHNADGSCPGREECLHRRCQNPLHLEAVMPGVNLARSRLTTTHAGWLNRGGDVRELDALIATMVTAGVNGAWRRPDCPLGHPLKGDNRILHPERGTVGCRECMSRTKRYRGHWLLQQG